MLVVGYYFDNLGMGTRLGLGELAKSDLEHPDFKVKMREPMDEKK